MFSDCYPEYKALPDYKRILQHWITNYEDIDNDNECIAQNFRDLSIDMQNNNIPEPESFFIESE